MFITSQGHTEELTWGGITPIFTSFPLARKSVEPSRVTSYLRGLDEGFLSSMLFETTLPRFARNSTSVFGTSWGRDCLHVGVAQDVQMVYRIRQIYMENSI